ncbi:MAG: thioredoxin [Alphaproteobacteria bacterium]
MSANDPAGQAAPARPNGAAPAAPAILDSSEQTFMTDVIEASAQVPVIVDFWAPWCGPCKTLGPLLEKAVTAARGKVRLVKINVDENQGLAAQLRIQSIPTVYAFHDGRPVDAFQGALPESQIAEFVKKLSGLSAPGQAMAEVLEQAQAALADERWMDAQEGFAQVLQQEPENGAAIAGLVRTLLGAGSGEQAQALLDSLEDSLRKVPEVESAAQAVALASQAAAKAGRIPELEHRLAQNPVDHQARHDLAEALYGAGRNQEAIDHLLMIIKANRDWNEQAARQLLLKIFDALGASHDLTLAGRRRLSTILFS